MLPENSKQALKANDVGSQSGTTGQNVIHETDGNECFLYFSCDKKAVWGMQKINNNSFNCFLKAKQRK